ncbi:MBL fold metallo-hydrolase [Zavarzinia sp. CC-PAN008]|uniref:MBL fold metallo-hydrolase n=1 Tax=Zavarzinia sp. CC-PAN008 TaxID=3243332 RepID=UPI003F743D88
MAGLIYPFPDRPEPGTTIEVADGVHWVRMPLPMALDHINLYLLRDGDGWTIVDTGIRGRDTKQNWEKVFAATLGGRPVKRVIVTHYHPDHVGQAGWLTSRWNAPLWMTRTEYLFCRVLALDIRDEPPAEVLEFYRRAGLEPEMLEAIRARGQSGFARGVVPLPTAFRRMVDGEVFRIGEDDWQVVVGRGHAPEHACLWCPARGLFIAGDQVLPRISSNVSVHPSEPGANPLEDWLESLARIRDTVPDDTLVLPAHNEPFRGLHWRLSRLIEGHESRLADLHAQCVEPKRALDVFSILFRKRIEGREVGLAIGESLAHLHCLEGRGLVVREPDAGGVDRWRSLQPATAAA